jgi:hypothetical protein
MNGNLTEADWGQIYGLKGHGVLCMACANEILEGEREKAKGKIVLEAEKKKERDQLREQQEQQAEKRGERKSARQPSLRDTGIMTDVKPPKDIRGLKMVIGQMRADFKPCSFRQQALDQALEDSSKLDERLHHDARWLLQRGYLKLVGQANPVINKEEGPLEGLSDAPEGPSLEAKSDPAVDTPQEEVS